MKLFKCQACGQLLYFENTSCESCGRRLGYLPEEASLSALDPAEGASTSLPPGADARVWRSWALPGRTFRFCANAAHDACNWLIPAGSADAFCKACRHNRTIPDISVPRNLLLWQKLEHAKHRLFYTLMRLRLPLVNRVEDPVHGLAFDFLANPSEPSGAKVVTGHENGVITIAVDEADDAERERMRIAMGEPYRTLLGHFRHEVGHWFWDVLVRDGGPGRLDTFRALFGDEHRDYGAALQAHYAEGPPTGWQDEFITAYASAHPWEDWAETWAHYLHMVDTLDTARAFGVRVRPPIDPSGVLSTEPQFDPHAQEEDVPHLVSAWLPLTFAVNGLNRSMGQPDLYPFVLSAPAIRKLEFVHDVVRGRSPAR